MAFTSAAVVKKQRAGMDTIGRLIRFFRMNNLISRSRMHEIGFITRRTARLRKKKSMRLAGNMRLEGSMRVTSNMQLVSNTRLASNMRLEGSMRLEGHMRLVGNMQIEGSMRLPVCMWFEGSSLLMTALAILLIHPS